MISQVSCYCVIIKETDRFQYYLALILVSYFCSKMKGGVTFYSYGSRNRT